ncbi:YdcF family protein [Leptolyngbya sp. PCC 6406]|uniref:YdcF family protein n=1 Tax=Leptolyngbya sp. PCC 6406 TaxID=1173264 RepID=UPI0002AC3209|nr:YdcF family protein [Leptolyngbya sp. PCC 6406]
MFLFLSKLLPLLIYPLGFSCVLIVVTIALAIWGRRRWWAATTGALALGVLLIGSNAWVATRLMQSLEWRYLPPEPMPQAEAIVVLGGGTRSALHPRPWVDLSEAGDRVLHGIRLYQAERAPMLIFSGGRVPWRGGGQAESTDMATIATAFGVPRSAIVEEPRSLNTYENAMNVKAILERRGIDSILLVTSASHMPRSLAIFRKLGITAIAAPTDFWVSEQSIWEVSSSLRAVILSLLPDADNLNQVSRALKEYLGLWIYRLRGWA